MPSFNMSGGVLSPQTAFGSGRGGDSFPSPWLDQASLSMPDNNKNNLEWCEYIFQGMGTYRMAQERINSYFLTDLEFTSPDKRRPLGDDEKERWQNYMEETLGYKEVIQCLDRDRSCYGNGFATMMVPFKRFLKSPNSPVQYTFREMAENPGTFNLEYDAGKNEFIATDPHTKKRGKWKVEDEPDDLERKLRVKLWSPHDIEIITDAWTGQCDYVWKIPEDYKREIRRGNMYQLERAPMEVLKAIHQNGWYEFAPDAMFHLKEQTISGIRTRGWGLSRILINWRDIWYVQVLRRYNEAIALDYVIPFRLITPEARPGTGGGLGGGDVSDPLRMANMGDFRSQVQAMLRKRRKDPATWHTLPFPVKYQALGGDAQQLAPSEMTEQAYDILLNASGVPSELYRGTLQLQTAPVSLRLFEATHYSLVYGNNQFLSWAVNQSTQLLTLPVVKAALKKVTHADDFNKQMAALQMYMGQQLSGQSALSGLGFEWKDEQRRIAEEAAYQQQLQSEMQEEMDQAAFGAQIAKGQGGPGQPQGGGPAAAGGAPAGGGQVDPTTGQPMAAPVSQYLTGPDTPVTPQDLLEQAEMLAQELLGLPESQKDSELRMLKNKNEVLHALVTAKIKQQRQQAQTAGGAMLLGQQGAAGG